VKNRTAEKPNMKERRRARRYQLALAVVLRPLARTKVTEIVRAETQNVSSRGLYFTSASRLAVGSRFGLTLTLPNEVANGAKVNVDAEARVVRVERASKANAGQVGIGALIETYNIVRPKPVKS
jgi:hypothetical protein